MPEPSEPYRAAHKKSTNDSLRARMGQGQRGACLLPRGSPVSSSCPRRRYLRPFLVASRWWENERLGASTRNGNSHEKPVWGTFVRMARSASFFETRGVPIARMNAGTTQSWRMLIVRSWISQSMPRDLAGYCDAYLCQGRLCGEEGGFDAS